MNEVQLPQPPQQQWSLFGEAYGAFKGVVGSFFTPRQQQSPQITTTKQYQTKLVPSQQKVNPLSRVQPQPKVASSQPLDQVIEHIKPQAVPQPGLQSQTDVKVTVSMSNCTNTIRHWLLKHSRFSKIPDQNMKYDKVDLFIRAMFDTSYDNFKTKYFKKGFAFSPKQCLDTFVSLNTRQIDQVDIASQGDVVLFYKELCERLRSKGISCQDPRGRLDDEFGFVVVFFWRFCWLSCAFSERPRIIIPRRGSQIDPDRATTLDFMTKYDFPIPFPPVQYCIQPGFENSTFIERCLIVFEERSDYQYRDEFAFLK